VPQHLKLTPEAAAAEIAQRALVMASEKGRRVLIGIAGGPGTGKSTLAEQAIGILNRQVDGAAAVVPMDGFHMLQAKLERHDLAALKGAPQTFEAEAFVNLLERLKTAGGSVPVPAYSRRIEDVVPNAFEIDGNVPILMVEGNYLLLDQPHWDKILPLLDLSFFIDVPADVVRKRLKERHARHGLFSQERNKRHIEEVDMVNYETVRASGTRADVSIEIDSNA